MRAIVGGVKDVTVKLSIPSLGIGWYDIDGKTYYGIRVSILEWKDKFAKFRTQEDWKAFFYSRTGELPSLFSHVDVFVNMPTLHFYLVRVLHGTDSQGTEASTESI